MKTKFLIVLFLILVGIIVIQYVTRPVPADYTEYIKIGSEEYILLSSKIDTIWMPGEQIIVPDYVPVPGGTTIVEVPAEVDTTAILQDYFAKYSYSDTVPLDSIGTVQINDTISRNKIISRKILFDYNIPIVYNTTIVKEKPKTKVYLGGGINFDKTDFINSAYGSALLKTKTDKLFGLNIGASTTNNQVKPFIGGSMYWKLNFNKK